ncbi:ribonuclease M5 [Aquibacillus koreensis]|uniref:Ribonuclease M5 n=1 Tax=Aquibacillus koreensis TaxID=279446 RepID=A0A9X3WRI3_9BACI|nr:ribonuclease M5 [Aquibacillus koreensis]MCT2534324.1 ribonuclease M5 [Aquibacillus koreensis]MDC3422401.1 ribonuclease M5 [Aquibacillus koreensis]
MFIKEVIVVEGKDDSSKIKQAVQADTIETNGSAINDDIINQIKHAKDVRGIIIFTDPDYPGERIRHIVSNAVPGCKHAFLTKAEARAKHDKGIGIEHASLEAIQQALANVYEVSDGFNSYITKEDLLAFGLLGGPHAKERRSKLGLELRIGYTNGKQLLKRLNMFHISKDLFVDTMERIIRGENDE